MLIQYFLASFDLWLFFNLIPNYTEQEVLGEPNPTKKKFQGQSPNSKFK